MQRIPLGPFELESTIGRGGMGEVWKGRHVAQGVPVAVKIILQDVMRSAEYLAAFRTEVQAVAALDHPGIVVVLDYGEVTPEAAEASGGRLVAGSPYIVMEYAEHGNLAYYVSHLRWRELREVLLVILDALAHAHARSVIHRDLKPENILVCGERTDSLRLTDFGLAHLPDRFERAGNVEACWGTPQYMAPEQLRGLWRDYGPWTDLYALGCMAYELVSGRLPFEGNTVWELGQAHLSSEPPPLEPRYPVPQGFEAWVGRLLQKAPRDRFQFAADAAWALSQLGDPVGEASHAGEAPGAATHAELAKQYPPTIVDEASAPTLLLSHLQFDSDGESPGAAPTFADWFDAASQPDVTHVEHGEHVAGSRRADCPPMPAQWRRPPGRDTSVQLLGAGLGLYGLRTIPLVDRDRERDVIWERLADVRVSGQARALLVTGDAGTGKSRLVEWMCERAHELGAAHVLRAFHGPQLGPADGLEGMLRRHLRAGQLGPAELFERVRRILQAQGVDEEFEWNALTDFLSPVRTTEGGERVRTTRFFSSQQRYALLYRYLTRLSADRPVVVWIDDVQWGGDALGFVGQVLAMQELAPAPILMLMTARDEALLSRPTERARLDEVLTRPGAAMFRLRPLERDDARELAGRLLGLDAELIDHIEARTGGNPLFAVQLVGDWVARGNLTVGANGFELRPGATAEIPDDIHNVWALRLEAFTARHGADGVLAMQVAAALGQDIELREWHDACERVGVAAPARFVATLTESGLVRGLESGWTFAHGMLRESVERSAREEGNWARVNVACAHMLYHLYGPRDFGISERFAWHMIEAGRPADALEPLLVAVDLNIERSDLRHAHDLLDAREALIGQLGIGDDRPTACHGLVRRSQILELQGRYNEALSVALEAVHHADRRGWPELLAGALLQQGLAERRLGRLDDAFAHFESARALFGSVRDELGVGRALLGAGRVFEHRGDYERAARYFDQARGVFERLGDGLGAALCYNALGDAARNSGDFAHAQALSEHARTLFESIGNQLGVADCLNDMSEWRRLQGDYAVALQKCLRAVELYESLGSDQAVLARTNLGLIYLGQGEVERALEVFEALERRLRRGEQWSQLVYALSGLVQAYAELGRWEAFDASLDDLMRLADHIGIKDPAIAAAMRAAADLCTRAGQRARSARALVVANAQRDGVSSTLPMRAVKIDD